MRDVDSSRSVCCVTSRHLSPEEGERGLGRNTKIAPGVKDQGQISTKFIDTSRVHRETYSHQLNINFGLVDLRGQTHGLTDEQFHLYTIGPTCSA